MLRRCAVLGDSFKEHYHRVYLPRRLALQRYIRDAQARQQKTQRSATQQQQQAQTHGGGDGVGTGEVTYKYNRWWVSNNHEFVHQFAFVEDPDVTRQKRTAVPVVTEDNIWKEPQKTYFMPFAPFVKVVDYAKDADAKFLKPVNIPRWKDYMQRTKPVVPHDMLRSLVDPSRPLSSEQAEHIDTLQREIDEVWSRRGDYHVDPDAWESMPIFMETISEDDIARNANCAALASIVYDEVPPDEIAENRKAHGNRALQLALQPTQERRENLARAACHSYTEALQAKGKDSKLACTIYANRSLAQFIIGNYGHGLQDAQRAIVLDPTYHKAYYRGARCAERLRRYDLACDLLARGRGVAQPPLDEAGAREFDELARSCAAARDAAATAAQAQRQRTRAAAASVSNLARALTSAGIRLGTRAEVTSAQMSEYGDPRPYFDTDGLLHVPVLLLYDEYAQSDMARDVATDASAADVLAELMPFPWDVQRRYADVARLVVFYKVDDGVHEPAYYEVDKSWPLLEVFRSATYEMPLLLPVLHVVCEGSELIDRYKLHRCA